MVRVQESDELEPIQPARLDSAFVELLITEWPAMGRGRPVSTPDAASGVGASELRRLADAPMNFEGPFDGSKTLPGGRVIQGPPADARLRLRVEPRGQPEKRIPLGQEPVTIGRRSGNTVAVQCDRLSRVHARIWRDEAGVHLADNGSSNGTFVNGVRITACDLAVGDVVKLGSVCVYVEEDAPAS